jgi:hypothetical protein
MKKQLLAFIIITFLCGCGDSPKAIKPKIKANVPYQFKDPYIKMLDLCGDWDVLFKVDKINNKHHNEKVIKEKWKIKHESNRVILNIIAGNTLGWNTVKKFEGEITGNKLTVEGENLNVFTIYEINLLSEKELSGVKNVIFPDPASVDYKFNAVKTEN